MPKVKLDLHKLLGFRILAQEGEDGSDFDKLGSKIGQKTGIKQGTKPGIPNRH